VKDKICTQPKELVHTMQLGILKKISQYKESLWKKSSFNSDRKCTQKMVLHGNKPPGRVKFGTVTVFYI
jgi:hypothetical protein